MEEVLWVEEVLCLGYAYPRLGTTRVIDKNLISYLVDDLYATNSNPIAL